MSKQHHPLTAEERLEIVRERVAPTLARIAIQVHLDEERKRVAEQMHRKRKSEGPTAV